MIGSAGCETCKGAHFVVAEEQKREINLKPGTSKWKGFFSKYKCVNFFFPEVVVTQSVYQPFFFMESVFSLFLIFFPFFHTFPDVLRIFPCRNEIFFVDFASIFFSNAATEPASFAFSLA